MGRAWPANCSRLRFVGLGSSFARPGRPWLRSGSYAQPRRVVADEHGLRMGILVILKVGRSPTEAVGYTPALEGVCVRFLSSYLLSLLFTALLVISTVHGATGHAQTDQATIRAVPQSSNVSRSTHEVDVSIDVENVHDLAGFQFVLAVDGGVVKPVTAQKSLFLAQTGREIVCNQPTVESSAIRLACVTLRDQPPGVDGNGTIATVILQPVNRGTSSLSLTNTKLVHRDGTEIPSSVVNGQLIVRGDSWWTTRHIAFVAVGIAILLVAGLVVYWRVRGKIAVKSASELSAGP